MSFSPLCLRPLRPFRPPTPAVLPPSSRHRFRLFRFPIPDTRHLYLSRCTSPIQFPPRSSSGHPFLMKYSRSLTELIFPFRKCVMDEGFTPSSRARSIGFKWFWIIQIRIWSPGAKGTVTCLDSLFFIVRSFRSLLFSPCAGAALRLRSRPARSRRAARYPAPGIPSSEAPRRAPPGCR